MNILALKDGVQVGARHFDPEFAAFWVAVLEKSPSMTDGKVWITSGADKHEVGLHPNLRALDVRTKNIQADTLEDRRQIARKWADGIRNRLGKDWDVFFELFPEPDRDHIHGELDRKGPV